MYGLHKPMRCIELLFTAYDCGNYGNAPLPNGVISTITRAVSNWNTGERHLRQQARVAINQIELPEPARTSAAYLDRMAKVQEKFGLSPSLDVAKFNPNWATQPRQPEGAPDSAGGQFASNGDVASQNTPGKWFLVRDDLPDRVQNSEIKQNFIKNYWNAFVVRAPLAGVPPAYLAGLSAHETTYATSSLFTKSNNLFNLHANTNSGANVVTSGAGTAALTKFRDPSESIDLFIEKKGYITRSISRNLLTPLYFAQQMHDRGKFGVGDNNFVKGVCRTIKGFLPDDLYASPNCEGKKNYGKK